MTKSKIEEVIEEATEEEKQRIYFKEYRVARRRDSSVIDFQHVLGALATMPLSSHLAKKDTTKRCIWCGRPLTKGHNCLGEEEMGFELLEPGEQVPLDFPDEPGNCTCDQIQQKRESIPLKNGRCAICGGK